jgi:hypothetical protein
MTTPTPDNAGMPETVFIWRGKSSRKLYVAEGEASDGTKYTRSDLTPEVAGLVEALERLKKTLNKNSLTDNERVHDAKIAIDGILAAHKKRGG